MKQRILIVGCGAVAELYHAPALLALGPGVASVTALADPDPRRRAALGARFPTARVFGDVREVPDGLADLALVTSPVRFHAEQAEALLGRGLHVFCEKPLAATLAQAERLVAEARAQRRALAVGLFRRYFPALQALHALVAGQALGALRRFAIEEGGPFNWPCATPSFFDLRQAGGGVLLDAGVHVLDLLLWWLGEPQDFTYRDDAEGGLESSCQLRLQFRECGGTVVLSRDAATTNRWVLEFERGVVTWRVGEADRLDVQLAGVPFALRSTLERAGGGAGRPADTYQQAFTRQWHDLLERVGSGQAPPVPGDAALPSLRLIERCYAARLRLEGAAS